VRRSLAAGEAGLVTGLAGQQLVAQLQLLSANLILIGPSLELTHKDQMDKLNHALMAACRLDCIDLASRVNMLQIIELRSMNWRPNENVTTYYKQKLAQIQKETGGIGKEAVRAQTAPVVPATSPVTSGNNVFFKELPTVSQPQKSNPELKTEAVPKEIRKSSISALPGGGHEAVVVVRGEQLVVTGGSADLVRTAKIVLNEFFNICPPGEESKEAAFPLILPPKVRQEPGESWDRREQRPSGDPGQQEVVVEDEEPSTIELVKPEICYDKASLLAMSRSPLCKVSPGSWEEVARELPGVVRRQPGSATSLPGPTSKLIQREMEGLRRQEEAKNV